MKPRKPLSTLVRHGSIPEIMDAIAALGAGGVTYSEGEVSLRAQLASALVDAKTLVEERDAARSLLPAVDPEAERIVDEMLAKAHADAGKRKFAHAHCEARAVELYDRAKAAEKERDEAIDEREQCRKLYEAECERKKTLERELGKR